MSGTHILSTVTFDDYISMSEINRKRIRNCANALCFCAKYDLNPWEIWLCYIAQLTDIQEPPTREKGK